ncbi:MAG: PilN domain-containing protein [Allorhizobium sp.]
MNIDLARDIWDWLRVSLPRVPLTLQNGAGIPKGTKSLQVSGTEVVMDATNAIRPPWGEKQISNLIRGIDRTSPITISFAQDCFLRRNLASKKLPCARARELAMLDLAEHMPFLQGHVYVLFGASRDGIGTDYFAIKKDVLDPILAALLSSGVSVDGMLMREHGRVTRATSASIGAVVRGSAQWPSKSRLLAGMCALVIVVAVATFGYAYARTAMANDRLDGLVDNKRLEALAVRKKVDARQTELQLLQAARAAKVKAIAVSTLWEELTRILPDSTWLTDLSVHENGISITGFSQAAADLIAIADASPLFQDPRFTAPVMRVPGQEGERFTIQMKVALQ